MKDRQEQSAARTEGDRPGPWRLGLSAVALATLLSLIIQADAAATVSIADKMEQWREAMQSADYQVRASACIDVRRSAHVLLQGDGTVTATAGDDSASDPCGDSDRVRIVLDAAPFARTAGPPNEYSTTFDVRARGSICVRVTSDGVAVAQLAVDGTEILGAGDIKPAAATVDARHPVELGEHSLDIRLLAGPPGATLTVEVRAALAEDLVELVDMFDETLADPSENVVREALTTAVELPLEDVQEVVGAIATRQIGNFSSVTLVVAIRAYVRDSAALYDLDDPELEAAVDVLGAIALGDRAGSVRTAAAQGIATLEHPTGIAILEEALATEPNAEVALAIRNALANLQVATGGTP